MLENRIHVGLCNGGNLAYFTGKYKHRAGFSARDLDIYMTSPGLRPSKFHPLAQLCVLSVLASFFSGSCPHVPPSWLQDGACTFQAQPLQGFIQWKSWDFSSALPSEVLLPHRDSDLSRDLCLNQSMCQLCADWCGSRLCVHTLRKSGVNKSF